MEIQFISTGIPPLNISLKLIKLNRSKMSNRKSSSHPIFFYKTRFLCLIILLNINLQCTPPSTPLIIGHRGAKGHVAENTLPSVAKAMELGVDGIEIDIFLCKSGELVVFHDKKLDRLTNAQGYIESLEYDSIKRISVLGQYKIPTLDEVLELIDGKVFLNIELEFACFPIDSISSC